MWVYQMIHIHFTFSNIKIYFTCIFLVHLLMYKDIMGFKAVLPHESFKALRALKIAFFPTSQLLVLPEGGIVFVRSTTLTSVPPGCLRESDCKIQYITNNTLTSTLFVLFKVTVNAFHISYTYHTCMIYNVGM